MAQNVITNLIFGQFISNLACSRLSVSEDDRKSEWAASGISYERDPGSPLSLPDSALHPPAFSIVHTDREPGTGYFKFGYRKDL